MAAFRDHPRTRGEHTVKLDTVLDVSGSPPHARGALKKWLPTYLAEGITPARAGSTSAPPSSPCPARDHPRTRGEHNS